MGRMLFVTLIIACSGLKMMAGEGMWIPTLLEQLNIREMQQMGLKLSAEDIYSANHSSLKDAIVLFGGGCTAEIVSAEGLIFTNYHCGYGSIQRLSSVQHDFLNDGFWAITRKDEMPCSGLTVSLLVRMEDVTAKALEGITAGMNLLQRSQLIRVNTEQIEKEAVKGTKNEARVRPFYYGNQYYLMVYKVFRDIRLVGAPPASIGKFGGDTDNWIWPRHTGDFSVFRIYADKNNEPSEFAKENVPYVPGSFLPVSLKGYEKGDFTFVFGYPGTTREYIPSYAAELIAEAENPVRIKLREKRLDIMAAAMDEDKLTRIQYSNKYQGIANGWKKMEGETKGLRRNEALTGKVAFEKEFQRWADLNGGQRMEDRGQRSEEGNTNPDYSALLPEFKKTYDVFNPVDLASVYLQEAGLAIELVRYAGTYRDLVKICNAGKFDAGEMNKAVEKLRKAWPAFFKDYQERIDRKVMAYMLAEMSRSMERKYLPGIFDTIRKKYTDDFQAYTDDLFQHSVLSDSEKVKGFLLNFTRSNIKTIKKDPAFQLASSIYFRNEQDISPVVTKLNSKIDSLQRIYMEAQMEMQKDKRFYPDANSTLRIAYGKIDGFHPADAVDYNYFTTSKGILEKEDTAVYDYQVDPKLKKLFLSHDFGRYADKDSTLHIAFIATNHTTGGNSGSPVLDSQGRLIGLNFDRNWEGTMSDLMYDPDQCRNITLDIRYCLFIIDKYAGAGHLLKEMKLVD